MNTLSRLSLTLITCASTVGTALHAEDSNLSWRSFEIGLLGASHNLEGPGVTGFGDDEGEDESSYGVFARYRTEFSDYLHLTADLSYESIDSDISLVRGYLAPGIHYDFNENASLYGEVGLSWAMTDGLEDYAERRVSNDRTGGSDIGVALMVGFRHRFGANEWHIAGGYTAFGREDYPGGDDSTGDGAVYELGYAYHINEDMAISATWVGNWIEDAGYDMDLATRGVRVGLRWNL